MKVVILSYNHPELTERTVQSARSKFSDSEILLVHNGSQIQHQKNLTDKFPSLEHLVLPENRGFPGGANAGLHQAFKSAEWILFLTNDCRLLDWRIPQGPPALVAPMILARKLDRVDSIGGRFDIQTAHLSHCKTMSEFLAAPQPYVPGTAFWIHRDLFMKVGDFDESLGMFWEDVDFSVRAQRLGFPLKADDSTRILHAIGKTTHKDSHYTTYLFQRNRKRISLKYAKKRGKVLWHLATSWCQMAWRHLKRGNWDRLKLLGQAIWDE